MARATSSDCGNRRLGFLPRAVAEETAYQIESERTSAKSAGRTKVQPRLAFRSWPGGFLDAARAARLKPGLLSG